MVVPSMACHQSQSLLFLPLALIIFLGAAFSLRAYTEIFIGPPTQVLDQGELEKRAHLTLYGHVLPLLGLIF